MADLRTDFVGIRSPNPFWLASAPPTDKEYNVRRAFEAGWGGVVWKTLGLTSAGGMLALEFYFILGHGSFVILGMVGAIKAVGGQCWRFPLIGPALPDPCP